MRPANPVRWTWLPLPVMAAVILGLWAANVRTIYESPLLLMLTNFIFTWIGSLSVAVVAGRSFLTSGQPNVLLFGCGALLWGTSTLLAGALVNWDGNVTITIHNLGALGAALCHFAGLLANRRKDPLLAGGWMSPLTRLLLAYAGMLGLLGLIIWASTTGRTPVFFVQGQGGTLVRQMVLGSAIVLLGITAGVLLGMSRRRPIQEPHYYAMGLALLALGLLGVWLQKLHGSPLSWAGRIAQCTGGVYLFLAAWAKGGWTLSFEPARWDARLLRWLTPYSVHSLRPWQRYAWALVMVVVATTLRWLFIPWLGTATPHSFAILATIGCSVLLGMRAGILCLLSGVAAAELIVLHNSPEDWDGTLLLRFGEAILVGAVLVSALHATRAAARSSRLSEERYQRLFNSMAEGFGLHRILTDGHGHPCDFSFLDVNTAYERLIGRRRQDLLGKTAREVLPGLEARWFEEFGLAALQGKPVHFESFATALGRWFSAVAYRTTPGQFALILTDITARKEAEAALARERDLLHAVMNGAKNSHLVYLDRDFHFVHVNETYAAGCGYRPEEMIGKNHFALYPHPENEAIFRRVRDTGEAAFFQDKPFEFPDQPERGITYWDWTLTPVKDPHGQVKGLILSLYETTARKRAEQERAASMEELREAQHELMRQERLATLGRLAGGVAHEMRTPLMVIQNGTYFLKTALPSSEAPVREVLEEIERAVASSDHIISEMLDYVREPTPCQQAFPLAPAIEHALHWVVFPGTIERKVTAPALLKVYANEDQITRILVNLIQNAIQAMPRGGLLEIAARPADEGFACVSVRDSGCGIPAENLEKIFEPLFSTRVRGIGLGLAIARRYAQLNGGSLTVESEVGRGTLFRLRLPLPSPADKGGPAGLRESPPATPDCEPPPPAGKSVSRPGS